jgi:uncharacterized protein YbjT (DUF2867 family)
MEEEIMKIAVAGATGRLGRHVSEALAERGHEVVAISRANGVDIITGAGLDAALNGVEVIVDVATGPSPDQQPATDFFVTAAHNLQEAGVRAGVRRAVVVSIVNIDKSAGGYGLAKIAHEDAWRAGPIPVRIVRAAQFHEFVAQLLEWGTQGDVAYIPEMRTQIVAARTVAEVAADVATSEGDPAQIVEIAGPREEDLAQLATMLVERRGTPVKVQVVRNPADPDADMQATGGMLPGPGARLAGPTFEQWLDAVS